jgi:hypothetical protein
MGHLVFWWLPFSRVRTHLLRVYCTTDMAHARLVLGCTGWPDTVNLHIPCLSSCTRVSRYTLRTFLCQRIVSNVHIQKSFHLFQYQSIHYKNCLVPVQHNGHVLLFTSNAWKVDHGWCVAFAVNLCISCLSSGSQNGSMLVNTAFTWNGFAFHFRLNLHQFYIEYLLLDKQFSKHCISRSRIPLVCFTSGTLYLLEIWGVFTVERYKDVICCVTEHSNHSRVGELLTL